MNNRHFFLLLLLPSTIFFARAQKIKIAVFAPLYIDSAFHNDSLSQQTMPDKMISGIEFYNGVITAIDSLKAEHADLTVLIYDTKANIPIVQTLVSKEFVGVSMIIAAFENRNEIEPVSNWALQNKVPLISVTYPSLGNVVANPYFVLINSSLQTHCEHLFDYIQDSFPTKQILLVRRDGQLENMIEYIVLHKNATTQLTPLKLKTVRLRDGFIYEKIVNELTNSTTGIVFCASVYEPFGLKVVRAVEAAPNPDQYIVIGMPTWGGLPEWHTPEYAQATIIYSSPYNFRNNKRLFSYLSTCYREKMNNRPSAMFFKGYESMFHFTKLLQKHGSALVNNLSDTAYTLFNRFDIRPVYNSQTKIVSHLENQQLYFTKIKGGEIMD